MHDADPSHFPEFYDSCQGFGGAELEERERAGTEFFPLEFETDEVQIVSLSDPVFIPEEGGFCTRESQIPDPDSSFEEDIENRTVVESLRTVIPLRSRLFLEERVGSDEVSGRSLTETARDWGLHPGTVRRIEQDGIRQARQWGESASDVPDIRLLRWAEAARRAQQAHRQIVDLFLETDSVMTEIPTLKKVFDLHKTQYVEPDVRDTYFHGDGKLVADYGLVIGTFFGDILRQAGQYVASQNGQFEQGVRDPREPVFLRPDELVPVKARMSWHGHAYEWLMGELTRRGFIGELEDGRYRVLASPLNQLAPRTRSR